MSKPKGWSIWFAWRPVYCHDTKKYAWLRIVWIYRSKLIPNLFDFYFERNSEGLTPQEAAVRA